MRDKGKTRKELASLKRQIAKLEKSKARSRHLEITLKEREDLYQTLLETSPEAIIVVALNSKIIMVNKRLVELHGFKSPKEIIGKNAFKLVAPQDRQRMRKNRKKILKYGSVRNVKYTLLKKNGTSFLGEASASVILDAKGKAKLLIGLVRDITESDILEKRLRMLGIAVEQSIDGIAVADIDGNVKFVNLKWAKMHGYRPSELIGKHLSIFHTKEQMKKDVIPFNNKVWKLGAHYGEVGHVKKNGATFYTWMSTTILRDENRRPIGLVGIARDITEHKKMEESLKKLNKELLQSNKKLKQLALKDPQTGLYNHRYLPEAIEAEFYRARRYVHPFSLMMLDIDYFKSINDVYGHKFGDLVLRQVAKQLINLVRRYDITIRFGGEEFAIISPGTDRLTALTLGRRLLDSINLYNFGNKKHTIKLTFSIAVVSYPEDRIVKYMDLVDLAEHVLERVKEDGGNRVYSSLDIKKYKIPPTEEKKEESTEVKFLREKLEKLNRKSKQNLIESIFAFAKTIELKDHYTGEHVERSVHYAAEIARALGLSREEIIQIRQAAILHDLGKVGISEKILLKKSKLNKKEFDEIMKHPQIGTDIIRPIKFLHDIIPLILYHHENWDGTGYPGGLKRDEIPIGARIISIADVYQALISDRPYRKAYPKGKVIKMIKGLSGTKFDPKIAKVFLGILKKEK